MQEKNKTETLSCKKQKTNQKQTNKQIKKNIRAKSVREKQSHAESTQRFKTFVSESQHYGAAHPICCNYAKLLDEITYMPR